MASRLYALAGTFLTLGALGQSGCTTKTCSPMAESYDVTLDREMDTPIRDAAQLSVELCGADGGCRTATVSPVTRELVGNVRGAMVASAQGRTRVHVTVAVVENTPALTLRVRDQNGALLLDSRAPLQWTSDGSDACTAKPATTVL